MTAQRLLIGVAVVFGLLGAVLRVRPPRGEVPTVPPIPLPPMSRRRTPPNQDDVGAYQMVITSDVFSPTRTPPTVRFTPERATDQAGPPRATRRPRVEEPSVRLFGITVTPRSAVALIETTPQSGNPAIYRVGDHVGAASVAAITDSTVVLASARGELVLRLPPAKKTRP